MSETDPRHSIPEATEGRKTERRPRTRRTLVRRLGRLAAGVVAAIMLALALLEVDFVLDKAGKWAVGQFSPFENAEIRVESVSGGLLSGLSAERVTLTDSTGRNLVSVERVAARIRLVPLLTGHIVLSSASIDRPDVRMMQLPDSSWDLASVLPADTSEGTTRVTINDLQLRSGRLAASFLAGGRDSTLQVHDLAVRLSHFDAPANTFVVDSLRATFSPAGSSDSVRASVAGSFDGDVLELVSLRLRSVVSRLDAAGRLSFEDDLESFEDLDFTLSAAPLSFRDIAGFVPPLNASATMQGRLRITGSSSLLDVDGDFAFGDGAALTVRGQATPAHAERVTVNLTGQARAVDPDYLLRGQDTDTSPITASVDIDLDGPSLDQVSGDIHMHADPVRYGALELTGLQIEATIASGDADLRAAVRVNGADVALDGSGRPFDDVPSYRAMISAAHVDIRRFTEAAPVDSDLSADAWVDLRGRDLESLAGSIDIQIRPSSWGDIGIAGADSDIRLSGGTMDLGISGAVGGGLVRGDAMLRIGDAPSYTIRNLALERMPLAALVGDTTESYVTGYLSGSGEGTDLSTASADLAIRLDSTRYGVYRLRSGSANVSIRRGRLEAASDLAMEGGHFYFEGAGRPFDRNPVFTLTSARFDSVDLSVLTSDSSWRTSLTGTLTGRAGRSGGHADGQLEAEIVRSRVNEQEIVYAEILSTLAGDRLSADVDVTIPGGRVALRANGRPFDEIPTLEIVEGKIAGIDVSRILGNTTLRTDLNASFDVAIRGFDVSTSTATGRVSFAESVVNSDTLRSGSLVLRADSSTVTVEADLQSGGGQVMLVGYAELADDQDFELTGAISDISPTRLIGADSLRSRLNADFAFSGRGLHDTTLVRGRLDVLDSALEGVTFDAATARFVYDHGQLSIDTVSVRSSVGLLAGGGRISLDGDSTALPASLKLHSEITDLAPVGNLVPTLGTLLAEGSIDVSVTGPPADQRFRMDGHVRRIASGDLRVGELRLRAMGRLGDRLRIRDAEGRIEAEQSSLPNVAARTMRFDVAYRDSLIRFEGHAVVDDQTDARASGHVDLGGEFAVLTLESLRFGRTSERWELLTTSEVTLGDEYRVSNLLLYSGQQQVALDGYIDLDGQQSLVVSLEGLRIGPVSRLFGYEGLDGQVNGYIDLTGRAESPSILGSLSATIRSLGQPVGDLSVDLDYADLRLRVDARLRDEGGRTLAAEGFIPVDLRLSVPEGETSVDRFGGATSRGEARVAVTADEFGIGWIKPFLDPGVYSDIGGRLTGQVELSGTFDEPALAGSATITDGLLGLAEFRVTYTAIQVEARFADDMIHLDHLEAASGRGSLIGQGSVSLADLNLGDFNIDLSTEDFLAVDNRRYRAVVAADLTLTGTTLRPRLDGTIDVASADIFFEEEIEEFEPIRLSMQDLLTVEQRFGIRLTERDTTTFDFYEAMAMDLTVTMARDTWLRSSKNPTMDIQFTGSLDVSKLPFREQQVFGSIEVLPERSRIVQFGKAFVIKKGDLTYNGPIDDPVLELEAEYAIRAWRNPDDEVTITLAASGRLDELDVELTSDPTMELTDIVSYIAFGRPASESLHLGGGGEGGSLATGLALGQVANLIEGVAGSGLGLDVVEIEQQGLDTRLTAGKYVHSKLYLSISQPLSLGGSTSGSTFGNKREITAEFEVIESLLLRLLSRKGSISVNLLWQYAY